MSTATSSARYTDLYDYCRAAEQIDHDLINQADRLADRLNHFEATCRESSFRVGSDSLGPALRSYGVQALPVDRNVRTVGERFERADGIQQSWWERINEIRIDWGQLLASLVIPGFAIMPLLADAADWVAEYWEKAWLSGGGANVWEGILDYLPWLETAISLSALSALSVRASELAGRVGVSAPGWSRFYLELASKHPYNFTLIKELAKPIGKGVLLAAILKSLGQWYYDFQEFKDDKLEMGTAFVYDAALILVETSGVAAVASGIVMGSIFILKAAGLIAVASFPPVAVGAAIVAVGVGVGLVVDHFFFDPYLRGDAHSGHVGILADNVREFKRDPLAFMKVFGGEIGNRLGDNAEEFVRNPAAFAGVTASELIRVVGGGLESAGNVLKDDIDKVVNFFTDDVEPPPVCVAI